MCVLYRYLIHRYPCKVMKHFPPYLLLISTLFAACGDDGPPIRSNPIFYGRDDGDSCNANHECHGQVCLTDFVGWPGGYCTTSDCFNTTCRGDDAICVVLDQTQTLCMTHCQDSSDCRDGYICARVGDQNVCRNRLEDGPSPGEFGAACQSDTDCLRDLECETSLPGGYCVLRGCESCTEASSCATIGSVSDICAARCEQTRDCRPGYICQNVGEADICVPFDRPEPAVSFTTTRQVLGMACNPIKLEAPEGEHRWEMTYTVPAGWTAYTIVPTVTTGRLDIKSIQRPGGTIDLVNDYIHHNLRAVDEPLDVYEGVGIYKTVSYDWPLMIPYAPSYQSLVEPGEHKIFLTTDGDVPCLYVLEGTQGTTLDLNIYLLGVPGLTAANVGTNPDVQAVLAQVNALFQTGGISLGQVRFIDGDRESQERYGIVRGLSDLRNVTALGQPVGPDLDAHLSVDVFWVEDILVGQTSGLILGLSAGVPGAPGLHGNANNGLLFRLADLGADNSYVAHIMAHEIAHYLGLRHTTETLHNTSGEGVEEFKQLVGTTDPINDTPVCSNFAQQGYNCPDASNLMFPVAPRSNSAAASLSPEQAQVLRSNPLVK